MKVVSNEKLIKRNATIAQVSLLAGLVISAAGVYVSFKQPDQVSLLVVALLTGYALSQVGIYFTNRWGRHPRPDEQLNDALKGMDRNHTIYHYASPVSHLLVGPSGIWALFPRHQRGRITFSKGRYRQRGGGFWLAYQKVFAQEGIGRPELEMSAELESLQKFFKKKLPEEELLPIQAALVFTSTLAEVEVNNAPVPTMKIEQLKSYIRKHAKEARLSPEKVEKLKAVLE